MSNMREVTEVSELKTSEVNGNTYVLLTFGPMVVDGIIKENAIRAFFCDKAFAKLIKPGLKMDVQPIMQK